MDGNFLAVCSEESAIDIYNVLKGGYAFQIRCAISQ